MSLFTNLAEMVASGFGHPDSTQAKIAQAVLHHIENNDGGGISDIVHQLEEGGLGHIVQSWIGTGPNQAISAEQLEKALGSDWLQKVADRLGIPPETISEHLSQILPKIVDRMTPDGKIHDVE
jgi:uncharacterized protein YidB (DUF937 family)